MFLIKLVEPTAGGSAVSTSINERALSLLGAGVQQETVATALGVTPSYISQLLSDENFAHQVTQLKFEALSKHTQRDASYDELEDTLLTKLKKNVNLLIRPQDILGAIKVVNGATRRGTGSQENLVSQSNIVQITMPVAIVQQFTTNINNQVIQAGEQSLLTMQSGDLRKQAEKLQDEKVISTTASEPNESKESNESNNTMLATL